MKKVLLVLSVFILFIGLGVGVMILTLSMNMKEIRTIEIKEMNLSSYDNQILRGKYYFKDEIGATVDVYINDGEITEIIIVEHIAGKGIQAEIIIEDIINEQSLLVDDIAGVTTSSHVIKLAIQNALEENE